MASKYQCGTFKVPKQWNHWLRTNGFRAHAGRGNRHRHGELNLYFKGKGRVWRISANGMLQCGDTYDRFDRWALTDKQVHVPLPRTAQDFKRAIEAALLQANMSTSCENDARI